MRNANWERIHNNINELSFKVIKYFSENEKPTNVRLKILFQKNEIWYLLQAL